MTLLGVLLVLTFTTGLIDAVSYLGLGRTFVANMTGNVIFLGFGIAGAPGLSILGALISLAAFLSGAFSGGLLIRHLGEPRARLLAPTIGAEILLAAGAAAVAWNMASGDVSPRRYVVIALLAFALGLRNSSVKALGVRDMTTTVLTLTITGLASDSRLAGGAGPNTARRLSAVAAMLFGAAAGALLVLRQSLGAALVVDVALLTAALLALVARSADLHVTP